VPNITSTTIGENYAIPLRNCCRNSTHNRSGYDFKVATVHNVWLQFSVPFQRVLCHLVSIW